MTSPRLSSLRARRGFTLLELILVLLVIALMSGVAIPAYFHRSEITLENAAVLLATDLRRAQNRAAHIGAPIEVTFDSRTHGYRIWQASESGENDLGSYVRTYTRDAVFEGVKIDFAEFGGDQSMNFDTAGRASEAGEVHLSYAGDVRIVRIEAPTGRLSIVGSSSSWTDRGF